jgi:hypothetical protein
MFKIFSCIKQNCWATSLYFIQSYVSLSLILNRGKIWNNFWKYSRLRIGTKINYCLRGQKTRWYYVFNLLSYERTSRALGYEKQWVFWEKIEPNWVDFKHFLTCLVLDVISRLGWGWEALLLHCSFLPLWGNALSFDSVLNMGISLDCFLENGNRKW